MKFVQPIISLINAIANLPNTFWGIVVLLMSMWLAVHYNKDVGIYFAGVGSTLLGINHFTPNTAVQVDKDKQVKVQTNASDSSGKD